MSNSCRASLFILVLCLLAGNGMAQSTGTTTGAHPEDKSAMKTASLPEGSWRFIVSGDSRNCGDIVLPSIAMDSGRLAPAFYWHLGDLRAIGKVDEDMAFAAAVNGELNLLVLGVAGFRLDRIVLGWRAHA